MAEWNRKPIKILGSFPVNGRTVIYTDVYAVNPTTNKAETFRVAYYQTNETDFNRVNNTLYSLSNGSKDTGLNLYLTDKDEKGNFYVQLVAVTSSNNLFITPVGNETENKNYELRQAIINNKGLMSQIRGTNPPNAATTNPEPAPPPAAAPPTTGTGANATTDPLYPKRRGEQAGNNVLIYPLNMHESQDYIRFEVMETTRTANVDKKTIPTLLKDYGDPEKFLKVSPKEPKIILPIQAPIVDQNLADWGPGELNEIQRMFAEESAKTMVDSGQGGIAGAFLRQISSIYGNIAANDKQYSNILYAYLLWQAVNAPGLSAKLFGGILNPNMELLFQGPQLRPFTFTFKMSPREEEEAKIVKQIINTFKKNMAPRADGIFLQSPNLFRIKYYHGGDEHQSINRIKTCSLQNCSVDYTPNQTYMTYDDEQASMVSYSMTLTFSEIVPIYQSDYDSHPIGF